MRPLFALALAACTTTVADVRQDPIDDPGTEVEPFDLEASIEVEQLMDHLEVLQGIADARQGNRVHLSQGYLDSVEYVESIAEDSGYDVTIDTYPLRRYSLESARVARTAPAPAELEFSIFRFSGPGSVEAGVVPVDLVLPPGPSRNSSTSGCELDDFAGFPSGSIALIQRGSCTFQTKADNAVAAGAAAVIIFNEGQEGRRGTLEGVLDDSGLSAVPVVGVSFATGESLATTEGVVVGVEVDAEIIEETDRSVLVTIPGRDSSRTLLVGAHLDSVQAGAGINDNGSGTAFLLEIMEQASAADWQPETNVTLAWWGAEELGLVGSSRWFLNGGEPDMENLETVEAYLNFDMMASSNGVPFVYDGDGSSGNPDLANAGSIEIEERFLAWFSERDQPSSPVGIFNRTDTYWAVVLGIPYGGVFSGAEQPKTAEEAELYGGVAGEAYDPCYHKACDAIDQIDEALYADLAHVSAAVTQQLADSAEPPPQTSSFAPDDQDHGWAHPDLPRPYGCHEDAIFDR